MHAFSFHTNLGEDKISNNGKQCFFNEVGVEIYVLAQCVEKVTMPHYRDGEGRGYRNTTPRRMSLKATLQIPPHAMLLS